MFPLGERIRYWRSVRGWTQEQLSSEAGIRQSSLSRIESGEVESPSVFIVKQIADALRISLDTLLGMVESDSTTSTTVTFDYVAHIIGYCKLFHDWMILVGKAKRNPWALVSRPRRGTPRPRKVLTQEEALAVVTAFPRKTPKELLYNAILRFLYDTGCRPVELRTLLLRHLDLDNREALVGGKGPDEGRVYFSPVTVTALRDYLRFSRPIAADKTPGDNHVFLSPRGGPISTQLIEYVAKEAGEAAGLKRKVRPYDLRHAYCTHLLEEGADFFTASKMMRHKSVKTTQIYAHLQDEERLARAHEQYHPMARQMGSLRAVR